MTFSSLRGAMLIGAAPLVVALVVAPASAQDHDPCSSICTPTLAFNVAANKSHVFGSPTVRNDTTGRISELPSNTALQLQFFASAKTRIERLNVFAALTWLPSAKTRANPFTEYTASQVGEDIKANHVSLSVGALGDLIPKKMAHGYAALQAYVADLLSPAARPADASAYTHKLDLGGVGLLYPFAGMDSATVLHKSGLYLYANLDYVATGLPKAGDNVPKGVRTFMTGAKPAVLVLGAGIPIMPFLEAQ